MWIWPCVSTFAEDSLFGTSAGGLLLLLLIVCASTDLTSHKIPNWATYPAVFWGLTLNALSIPEGAWGFASNLGAVGLGAAVGGLFACLGVMLIVYSITGGGAGDVKLAAGIGTLLGPERGLLAIACAYVLAAAVMLSAQIWTGGPLKILGSFSRRVGSFLLPCWITPPSDTDWAVLRRPVPMAGFLAFGVIMASLDWGF